MGRSRRPAYVITFGSKRADLSRFERRGIKVINLASNESNYGVVLADVFNELHTYWSDNLIPASFVKEEQPLRELSLPPEAPTRLCFFALPLSLYSFYKERVFSIIEEYGYVPVTADDVVSPGDTIFPKIDALIKRAQLFIVDISTQHTISELQLASRYIDPSRILIVSQRNPIKPIEISNYHIIYRPDVSTADPDEFLEGIRKWLRIVANNYATTLASEPRRLLNAGENRAAVISSITLLESNLRRWLEIQTIPTLKTLTFKALLEKAKQQEFLGKYEVYTILNWLKVRNEVVHSDRKISKTIAEDIVNGVLDIVERRN